MTEFPSRQKPMSESSKEPAISPPESPEAPHLADERFKLIARATSDVFWDWDLKTNAAWRSEGASEAFGYPPEELASDINFWINRIHPKDRDRVLGSIQTAIRDGAEFWREEYRFLCKNGSYTDVLDRGYVVHDAQGKPVRMVGALSDISKQREAEIKLTAERNLLRTVVDNLPDCIYAKDGQMRKIMANAGDLKNLGCRTEAEAIGKTDFDLFPKGIAEAFFTDDQTVLKTGKPVVNREEKMMRPDGEVRWLLTTKVPWRDAHGNIIGLVGIGRDITDKKHLEEQFLRAQRMESLGRMATGIAHDLNNILAPILISIALLRQKVQDDEGLAMLARLEASAKRGADIVKQVLGFGRGMEGQRMPVNPRLLVKDVIRIVAETFSKSIQVETDVAADARLVSGDMSQLHQVLLNLCLNARDAMPNGGKLKLSARNFTADAHFVSLNPEAKPMAYVQFEVVDTGHGIPPDIRDRIFEPFFTTKELGKGTGLGLSTTLSIVKSHNGFILVESEPGKGSAFQVYLPAMPQSDVDKNAKK